MPSASEPAAAIIVAAGRGTRLGAPDKVLLHLAGKPLLWHSVQAAEQASSIVETIVVAGLHTKARIEQLVDASTWGKVRHVALGGERRQDSVEAGLRLVSSDIAIAAIHDGARPLVTAALFDACVAAATRHGAAIAAVPVTDTLKRAADGFVVATIDRERMWAAQTPQAVRMELLRQAFADANERGVEVTDEAGLMEAQGLPVAIVPSTPRNLKVTRPEDVHLAEALLAAEQRGARR